MAETRKGLRVFDTNYFLDATKSPESIDQGYRWVLPQVGFYRQNGTRRVRFSSVETDRGGPALVTGAYADQKKGRLAVRWALQGDQLVAAGAWHMPTSNVQGVLQHNNVLVASSSFDTDAGNGIGELITGAPRTKVGRINWPERRRGRPLRGHERPHLLPDGEGRRPHRVRDRRDVRRRSPLVS